MEILQRVSPFLKIQLIPFINESVNYNLKADLHALFYSGVRMKKHLKQDTYLQHIMSI